jgi:hypothetical protein
MVAAGACPDGATTPEHLDGAAIRRFNTDKFSIKSGLSRGERGAAARAAPLQVIADQKRYSADTVAVSELKLMSCFLAW